MSSGETWGIERAATPQELLQAALSYTERGWRVVPLHTPTEDGCSCSKGQGCGASGKHPRIRDWPSQASDDPEQVRAWWEKWPHANIGIATGDGLGVIDVDPRNGGDDSLAALEAEHGQLPATVEAITGGADLDGTRGRHIYGRVPEGTASRDNLCDTKGVELKAEGRLVVAPPSRHPSGRLYWWELSSHPEDVPLDSLPEWVTRERKSTPKSESPSEPVASPRTDGSGDPYALAALRGCVEELLALQPHASNNRNHTLNGAAYRLGRFVGTGRLDEELVRRELSAAATYLGLGTEEVERTLDSGLEAGKQEPEYRGLDPRDQDTLDRIHQWEDLIRATTWKGKGRASERAVALAFAQKARELLKTTFDLSHIEISERAAVSRPAVSKKNGPLKRLLSKGYLRKVSGQKLATQADTYSLTFPREEQHFGAGGTQAAPPNPGCNGRGTTVTTQDLTSGSYSVVTIVPPYHDLCRYGTGAPGKSALEVYEVLQTRPAWKVSELAKVHDRDPKTIRDHLKKLANLPIPLARKEDHHWSAVPRTLEELDELAERANVAGKGEDERRKHDRQRELYQEARWEQTLSSQGVDLDTGEIVEEDEIPRRKAQRGVQRRARELAHSLETEVRRKRQRRRAFFQSIEERVARDERARLEVA